MVSSKKRRKLPATTQSQAKPTGKATGRRPSKVSEAQASKTARARSAAWSEKAGSKRALLVEHPSGRRQQNRLIADPKLTRRCQSSKLGAEDFLALPASQRRSRPGPDASPRPARRKRVAGPYSSVATMHAQVVR